MSGRRTLLITGAASGMGLATARLFAERGWRVAAYDVDRAALDALAGELGETHVTRPLDVTDADDYRRALAELAEVTDGRLDLLFNNAGVAESGWFEDVPQEAALRVIGVNYIGAVNGIYAALPLLRNTTGSLCFTTSSASAIYGAARLAIYASTKFAVKGLTEALSIEFSRHGVRVADVLPGLIDTALLDTTPNRSGEPSEAILARERVPREGPFRLMPAESVAECVWSAYHDETGRLHWYVPAELEELEKRKAADVEAMREQLKGTLPSG